MKLIIFFEYGRLGNQLFQYAAIKSLYPNYRLILFGFSSLDKLIETNNTQIISDKSKIGYLLKRAIRISLNILSKIKLFNCISEEVLYGKHNIKLKRGLYKNIIYIKSGNFQSKKYLDENLLKEILIKDSVIKEAELFLLGLKIKPTEVKFFIHIRLGDYLWRKPGESPAMSIDWYKKAIKKIKKIYPQAYFIVLSDDIEYVNSALCRQENLYFFHKNEITDIALMTLCNGGILSASSYSWWAAYFARKKYPNGLYLAPEYWMGYWKKEWEPSQEIKVDWIDYLS